MQQEEEVSNSTQNPTSLELNVFTGHDGIFKMYEDNSLTHKEEAAEVGVTIFEYRYGASSIFTISPFEGQAGIIPKERNYHIKFFGIEDTDVISVESNEKQIFYKSYDNDRNVLEIKINDMSVDTKIQITIKHSGIVCANDIMTQVFKQLSHFQIEYDLKTKLYEKIKKYGVEQIHLLATELKSCGLDEDLLGVLFEIIYAY